MGGNDEKSCGIFHFALETLDRPADADNCGRSSVVIEDRCGDRTGTCLSLVDQARLYDGVHYEQRIAERGQLATRHGNWHDLFNALVWKLLPETKSALNAGQVADILALGTRQRTRRQCAYTQFDEAGAVVLLRDPALLELWDRHDWTGLFLRNAEAWQDGTIKIAVVGHALFEHALHPSMLLVSRTLVLIDERRAGACDIDATVSAALVEENWLTDPQQLRPLPVSGIPGWHRSRQDADFYALQPCFRPLRPGRAYPAALRVNGRSCPG